MEENQDLIALANMSESFCEFELCSKEDSFQKRFFLPKQPLAKVLREAIDSSQVRSRSKVQLKVTTKLAKKILDKELGTPPALLVTQGFENWLDINIPPQKDYFTLIAKRPSSPLQSDFIFGVDERVDAQGAVQKVLKEEDLEFFAAKLKMNGISSVAVCFLHADKNPTHEEHAKRFLQSKGFSVFASHEFILKSEDFPGLQNERQRWWSAVLNAYSFETFKEHLEEFYQQLCNTLETDVTLEIGNANGVFKAWQDIKPLESLFAQEQFLFRHFQNGFKNGPQGSHLTCYLGLESFLIFGEARPDLWHSQYGPISVLKAPAEASCIQPTSQLLEGFWGFPSWSSRQTGYEPGPMCFGRATTPTLLDILFLNCPLENINGLESQIDQKAERKILELLLSSTRRFASSNVIEVDELRHGLFELFIKSFAAQLNNTEKNHVVFCGPFAPILFSKLSKMLPHKRLHLASEKYVELLALTPGGAR